MGQVDKQSAKAMVACKNESCPGGGITNVVLLARAGKLRGASYRCRSCNQLHSTTPGENPANIRAQQHPVRCSCDSADFEDTWLIMEGPNFCSMGGTCQHCSASSVVTATDIGLAALMPGVKLPLPTDSATSAQITHRSLDCHA